MTKPNLVRRTLLLIDDDPLIHRTLSRMLMNEWEVVGAYDADTARALLEDGERYDVIVCDVCLGPRESGLDVYEGILAGSIEEASKLVFLTGTSPRENESAALRRTLGETIAERWLMKPPRKEELLAVLARVADAHARPGTEPAPPPTMSIAPNTTISIAPNTTRPHTPMPTTTGLFYPLNDSLPN